MIIDDTMTIRWNKGRLYEATALSWHPPGTDRQPVPAAVRASLGVKSKVVRLEGLDPWLAAATVDDLFDRRFLWASDCERTRFAALGVSRSVDFGSLNSAAREAAEELELPARIATRLPMGLFVLGETDGRPGAFEFGESETQPHCWTPQVLLVADGNSLLVFCADAGLRRELVQRLKLAAPGPLLLEGCHPDLVETQLDCREAWRSRVERALTGIRRGSLEKLVVSRRLVFGSDREPFSPRASAWQVGRAIGRTGFSVSTDGGKSVFIGATPETLLKVEDGTVTTHALAGTRERSATLEEFLASSKLAEEHTFVSDGLVGKLRPFVSNLRPGPLRVRRSGSVAHLETPLAGDLRQGVDPLQILSDIHPTAAIGGLPQRAAQQALRQIEPYSRGWFAAPLGWLAGNTNMHSAIAIRSLWVSAERAVALAGAGIVRESVAEEEWLETEDKFDNMRAVIRGELFGK
jgi:isochorismate synthase